MRTYVVIDPHLLIAVPEQRAATLIEPIVIRDRVILTLVSCVAAAVDIVSGVVVDFGRHTKARRNCQKSAGKR